MKYRGYTIEPAPPEARQFRYGFCHPDYDGAPDANDNRAGIARSIEDAREQIDEIEDERE